MTPDIALYTAAGALGGAVNAAAGGAKLFVFPMLMAAGLPPVAANVTQSVALWPAQMPALWVYRRELRAEARAMALPLAAAVAASVAGALVMVNSDDDAFARVVPLLLAISVAAIVLGPRSAELMRRLFPGERLRRATGALLTAIGFYGGFFGAGMGFMLLAVFAAAQGRGVGEVNGAKNLFAVSVQTAAVAPMLLSGLVDWPAALCVLIGGVIGGYAGARLVRRLPERAVRIGVAGLGCVLTLSFLLA